MKKNIMIIVLISLFLVSHFITMIILKNYENGFYAQNFDYLFTLEDTTMLHYDLYMPYTPDKYRFILIIRESLLFMISGYILYQAVKEKNTRFFTYTSLIIATWVITFINIDNTVGGIYNFLRKMKVAYRLSIIEGTGLFYNMMFLLPLTIIFVSSIVMFRRKKE